MVCPCWLPACLENCILRCKPDRLPSLADWIVGCKFSLSLAGVAGGAALLCFVLGTLPLNASITLAAEELLEAFPLRPIMFSHRNWSMEEWKQLRELNYFRGFIFIWSLDVFWNLMSLVCTFSMVAWHAGGVSKRNTILVTVFGIVVLCPLLSYGHTDFVARTTFTQWALYVPSYCLWSIVVLLLFVLPLSHEKRRASLLSLLRLIGGSVIAYAIWQEVIRVFYATESSVFKVLIGSLGPFLARVMMYHLSIATGRQVFSDSNSLAHVLLLAIPIAGISTISVMLQLTSDSIGTSVAIELFSILLEVRHKCVWLAGKTEWENFRGKLASCMGKLAHCLRYIIPCGRSHASVCDEDSMDGVVPPNLPTDQTSTSPSSPSKQRKEFEKALCFVIFANLIELVVVMLSCGLLLIAKVNPNEIHAPPIPWQRTLMLTMLNLVCELAADTLTASVSQCMSGEWTYRVQSVQECWEMLDRRTIMKILFIVYPVVHMTQLTILSGLCPSPTPESMGSPGGKSLLSFGMCSRTQT
ncbi:unnamed protein product [Polarella glacialis]|uniref:Uncharacterized protein n=1 Tax=Polarella glacialis TaxID=89957 RepID=A0A813GZE9_POLGL|nr:unnamed protein product [Polarella glacialis]